MKKGDSIVWRVNGVIMSGVVEEVNGRDITVTVDDVGWPETMDEGEAEVVGF